MEYFHDSPEAVLRFGQIISSYLYLPKIRSTLFISKAKTWGFYLL